MDIVLSCILSIVGMKEATNFIRAAGQMAQGTHCFGFHVRKAENAGSPHPVRFHLPPYAFARIPFGTIPGQPIQAQLPLIAPYLFGYLPRLVGGMAIPNQKNRLRSPNHQTVQESANHLPIHFTLFNHKPHAAAPIHHAKHVQAISRARTTHHRGLPLKPPRRPRMIIAAQPGFIANQISALSRLASLAIAGYSSSIHCRTRAGSCWYARHKGFCGVMPN